MASNHNSETNYLSKPIEDQLSKININSDSIKANEADGKIKGKIPDHLISGHNNIQTRKDDDAYSSSHKQRGHCLIFNQNVFDPSLDLQERSGSSQDRDSAKHLFEALGFCVKVFDDLTVKDINGQLIKYAYKVDHSDCDCFVVVFMSHGKEDQLYGRNATFKSDLLYKHFLADHCASLAGKPKMFFVQACRGHKVDPGTYISSRDEPDSDGNLTYKIPNNADFLLCWSTVPGYMSYRNLTNGSWFIESLVKVFTRDADSLDVLSMMTRVNQNLILSYESDCPSKMDEHQKKQSAWIVSTLMRKVYLKPKKGSLSPPCAESVPSSSQAQEAPPPPKRDLLGAALTASSSGSGGVDPHTRMKGKRMDKRSDGRSLRKRLTGCWGKTFRMCSMHTQRN